MQFLADGPATAPLTVILAHGAGAAMDTPFMTTIAGGLAQRGWRVLRFEFPYMAARRTGGPKRPPDHRPVLLETWQAAIAEAGDPARLVIGGKSMGGRMASMVADAAGVAGLVCLGYPFHPPCKPDRLRTEHLETLRTPTLVCQGTRDPMGGRELVEGLALSPAIRLAWAADGDHSLKPRKASGRTKAQALAEAVAQTDDFLHARLKESRGRSEVVYS